MPVYEFRCADCGDDDIDLPVGKRNDKVVCPCGNEMSRVFHAPAVKLKGTGWFQTDYGNLDKQRAQGRRLEREKKIRPGHDLTKYESA